jgi:hypothetical protein
LQYKHFGGWMDAKVKVGLCSKTVKLIEIKNILVGDGLTLEKFCSRDSCFDRFGSCNKI